MRATAIVLVMIYHLRGDLSPRLLPVATMGWMGVDLFFVLSGYLIGRQLLKPYLTGSKPSLKEFYSRRAYRILPAYLFVVFLYFTLPVWSERTGIAPLWQFLSFTENLFVDYSRHPAFSHVWSLCVEEHFYLVLPLLVLWLMRRPSLRRSVGAAVCVVLLGVAVRSFELFHVLRGVSPEGDDEWPLLYLEHIYYPTYTRLDGLLIGVLLAATELFRPLWWRSMMKRGHVLMVSGLALLAVSMWLFMERFAAKTGAAGWGTVIGFPLLSLGLGMLVASSVSDQGWLRRWRVPGATIMATLAFSLYLTHKEVAHVDHLLWPQTAAVPGWRSFGVFSVSCLVVAALLHFCIERPFLRLRDWHQTRHEQPVSEHVLQEPAL